MPNPQKKPVDFLLFDPNRKILKKVTFTQPYEKLVAQLEKAENMIDRYDALLALKQKSLTTPKQGCLT